MTQDIYVSFNVETDGPVPFRNNLLSLGCVAFVVDREAHTYEVVDGWAANFMEMPGGRPDSATVEWWQHHPIAYEAARKPPLYDPQAMMPAWVKWVRSLMGYEEVGSPLRRVTLAAWPASFDWPWLQYYIWLYGSTGLTNPFEVGFVRRVIDIKSVVAASLGVEYAEVSLDRLPATWAAHLPRHVHTASGDAFRQGEILCAALLEQKR